MMLPFYPSSLSSTHHLQTVRSLLQEKKNQQNNRIPEMLLKEAHMQSKDGKDDKGCKGPAVV